MTTIQCLFPGCTIQTSHGKDHCLEHLEAIPQASALLDEEMLRYMAVLNHTSHLALLKELENMVVIDYGGEVPLEVLVDESHYFEAIQPRAAALLALANQLVYSEILILDPKTKYVQQRKRD